MRTENICARPYIKKVMPFFQVNGVTPFAYKKRTTVKFICRGASFDVQPMFTPNSFSYFVKRNAARMITE